MIQTFPTNRADQLLNVGVLPGRSRCGENLTTAQPLLPREISLRNSHPDHATNNAERCPTESFQQLVSHPFDRGAPSPPRGRAAGGRATESRRQITHERTGSGPRRRDHILPMVCQERAPGLRGWFGSFHHVKELIQAINDYIDNHNQNPRV